MDGKLCRESSCVCKSRSEKDILRKAAELLEREHLLTLRERTLFEQRLRQE